MASSPSEDPEQKELEKEELAQLKSQQEQQKEQDAQLEAQKLQLLKGVSTGGAGGLFTGSGLKPAVGSTLGGGTTGTQKLG